MSFPVFPSRSQLDSKFKAEPLPWTRAELELCHRPREGLLCICICTSADPSSWANQVLSFTKPCLGLGFYGIWCRMTSAFASSPSLECCAHGLPSGGAGGATVLAVPFGSRVKNIPGPGFSVWEWCLCHVLLSEWELFSITGKKLHNEKVFSSTTWRRNSKIPTVMQHDVSRERKMLEVTISCLRS